MWKLFPDTRKEWESVTRGMEKTGIRFLVASGLLLSPYQPWRTVNLLYIISSSASILFFLYVGAVSMYYARNDLITFVEIAHAYSLVFGFFTIMIQHYALKMPVTQEFYRMIDTGFTYKTRYGEEEDEKWRSHMRYYFNAAQNVLHLAIILAALFVGIIAPFLIKIFGRSGSSIKEINYGLPVPLWLPFETDTLLGYCMGYSLIFILVCLMCLFLSSGLPVIVFATIEVNTQYRILKQSILNLEQRALESYNNCSDRATGQSIEMLREDPLYNECIQECLKENILHHIEIIRLFNVYQEITSNIFGLMIGLSMAVLATLSIVLTKAEIFSMAFLKFVLIFVTELGVVFGYCLSGTSIADASQEVPSAIYDCPAWFNLNERHKRVLRIFQINSSVSLELKGSGIFLIDLQLFVQIVQTTYSIFNIFTSMEI